MFDPDVKTLVRMMLAAGAKRLLLKRLAENDNTKNQPYLGRDFDVLNYIPNDGPKAEFRPGAKRQNFKAAVKWTWLQEDGSLVRAPGAQLILYPDYPEVRLSGFIRGTKGYWNSVFDGRRPGRVLVIGLSPDGTVIAYASEPGSRLARSLDREGTYPQFGVFEELPAGETAASTRLIVLDALRRIRALGWINSKRLVAQNQLRPCEAQNCGGFTLEAELGVINNGRAEPDFHGWEIKQHNVPRFDRPPNVAVTLLTPEPRAGYYAKHGVERFIRKYGYADRRGREDRLNFGGIYIAGRRVASTGLMLEVHGWDPKKKKITDVNGQIALLDSRQNVAAAWPFDALLAHWRKKHDRACFVMSMCRLEPRRQYQYGPEVTLAEGPNPLAFIAAMAEGRVYLDPAAKIESASTKPRVKARSQFRTKATVIPTLYRQVEVVRVG